MRQAVSSILLGMAGWGLMLLLERYVTAFPEWAWRVIGLVCIVLGFVGAAITDAGVSLLRRAHPVTSGGVFVGFFAIIGLASYVLVAKPLLTAQKQLSPANAELKERALAIARQIDEMNGRYFERERVLMERLHKKEITQDQYREIDDADFRRVADEFEREYRINAAIIRRELRKRIPIATRAHIPSYMPDIAPADGGPDVNLGDILDRRFIIISSERLSNEIEELSKLLPDN